MFVSRIKMTNFGKLSKGEYTFTDGVNIIRGVNEIGKCVTGDTLIHTSKGTVRIDSLDEGFGEGFTPINETVFSSNGEEQVTHFYKEHGCEVIRVGTKKGYTVTGTKTHPLLVYIPEQAAYKYKNIEDLTIGDVLCIDRNINYFPVEDVEFLLDLPVPNSRSKKITIPKVMTADLAALCGYLVANGSGDTNCLNMSTNDPTIRADFRNKAYLFGVECADHKDKRKTKLCGLRCNSATFKQFIEALMGGKKFPTARHKTVPKSILSGSREVQRVFIRSLFDCDGNFSGGTFEWVTASKTLAYEVKEMLLNFGIITNTAKKLVKGYSHTYFRTIASGFFAKELLELVLCDSLKYKTAIAQCDNKEDVIPKLNLYIKNYMKDNLCAKSNGWMVVGGKGVLNTLYKGTTRKPQDNLQINSLRTVIKNIKDFPGSDEVQYLYEKLKGIEARGYYYSKITSIEDKGSCTVYDITVPGSHSFVANGIVSHNSTLVEAILYALFGTTALRGSLEDSTTQGEDPNGLKVELDFGPYKVLRSKSSASVVGNGTRINGQGAVSNFFYEVIGVQKGAENKVLVSEQGNTAGVLEGKAGEVNTLIEELAGFDQIDALIEKVKEKYPSGNQSLIEELLKSLADRVGEKMVEEVEDASALISENTNFAADLIIAEQELSDINKKISGHKQELAEIVASVRLKETLSSQEGQLIMGIERESKLLASTQLTLNQVDINIEKEEAYQDLYPTLLKKWEAYKSVSAVKPWGGDVWDESAESLRALITQTELVIDMLKQERTETFTNIKNQKSLINTDDNCPTCGQEVKHLHAEINLKATAEIDKLDEKSAELVSRIAEERATLDVLKGILAEQRNREEFAEYADKSQIPWAISWNGAVPEEPSLERLRECRSIIREATELAAEKASAATTVKRTELEIMRLGESLVTTVNQLNSLFPRPADDIEELVLLMENMVNHFKVQIKELKGKVEINAAKIRDSETKKRIKEETLLGFLQEEKDLKERLAVDSYNQNILKELRKARPLVVNKLWSNVLLLTSSIFNSMVGADHVVEKSEKGFVVNGLPVYRLSGSAKAVLGIALRQALRDIFAPSAGFMVFDEPAAFCDDTRRAAVASALSAIRGQVIVITHEDISDSSADNIIEVG